ncbi:hypothetical protein [Methylogaea oryzae]|uniref:Uncharacterized protein n=1 Tax=Methylogaea oryzae TaxID=1295382 RepID=A0A8D4VTR0_9GAMM|nr:hypothetical protein [Methylogaea oryzae]BBL72145.1 hypothetical protein MoryE10_27510 [Methylogaea oryzae]
MKKMTVAQAERNAAVFLLPPRATEAERAEELAEATKLMRTATEKLVRAGRDDLALAAQLVAIKSNDSG